MLSAGDIIEFGLEAQEDNIIDICQIYKEAIALEPEVCYADW